MRKQLSAITIIATISFAFVPIAESAVGETAMESYGPVEAGLDPRIQDDRWVCFTYDEQNQFYFGSSVHQRRARRLATAACKESDISSAHTGCWPVGCYRTDLYR